MAETDIAKEVGAGETILAGADPKVGAPAPAVPVPPVALAEIEIKAPEGMQLDEAFLGELKQNAKELGLKSEGAQKLAELFGRSQAASTQKSLAALEQTQKAWVDTLKADKELGGAEFDGRVKTAQKAMTKFGTPELREFLNSTGLGNHPELVRFVYRIGKALGEDSAGGTGSNGAATPSNSNEAFLRAQYPTMYAKE